MELTQLRYFVTIAETLSFTRAAELVHVSQPALSYQIRHLEEELKVKLFDRRGRTIALTSDGQVFLPLAQGILARANEAVRMVRDHSGVEVGEVTIGVVPSVATYLVPDLLASFRQVFPRVRVDLVEGGDTQLHQLVFAGAADFAIAGNTRSPQTLDLVSLGFEDLLAVTSPSHRAAEQISVEIAQLRNDPFVLPASSYLLTGEIVDACRRNGFEPSVAYRAGSLETLKNLVRAGLGISILPAITLNGSGREGLAVLRLKGGLRRELCLVRAKDRDVSQAAQVLMTHVRSSVTRHMIYPPGSERSTARTDLSPARRDPR